MDEELQSKQRDASFPHYNLIVRKEPDGIAVKIEAMLMVGLVSLRACTSILNDSMRPCLLNSFTNCFSSATFHLRGRA